MKYTQKASVSNSCHCDYDKIFAYFFRGKSTSAAELEFLEKASQLDTYGFDPYTVKVCRLKVYVTCCKGSISVTF